MIEFHIINQKNKLILHHYNSMIRRSNDVKLFLSIMNLIQNCGEKLKLKNYPPIALLFCQKIA